MYYIKTLNKISPVGLNLFDAEKYTVSDDTENPDAMLLRSCSMHGMEFPPALKAVGRAGAGTNNIPIEKCTEKGIVVFNTPGGNANAVKELVIAGLLLASRDIVGGIEWVKTLKGDANLPKTVESGKGQFVGYEVMGKKLGVIGLGAIGVLVANAAYSMGMDVVGVDPYISIGSAWSLHPSVRKVDSKDDLADCDYITIHVPCTNETKDTVDKKYLAKLKDGVKILNFARGELVNDAAMLDALHSCKVSCYVTDFPSEKLFNVKGVIALPHLGASTEESEDNCARMASEEIKNYLELGNIVNSVNYPDCTLARTGRTRFAVTHKNIPKQISTILDTIASFGINVDNMANQSKGPIGYTLIEIDGDCPAELPEKLRAMTEVVNVRVM
ncbi:MAG: 3-phosphoglycerate dehydrogenase [Oscillospiraceae bacterium]|jgi:D-3-phosphoglycerate dehydrogenase|nr:3-phosphoglycerate dehydrogenase [Oscillospiraceae bacterium]